MQGELGKVTSVGRFLVQHLPEFVRSNISCSQENRSLLPKNDVAQELSEVIVEDDDLVEAGAGPNLIDINDGDEAPFYSFVQDTGNEPWKSIVFIPRCMTWY